MTIDSHDGLESRAQSASFGATHWSVVLAAARQASPEGKVALEKLCRTYWRPIYCYIRRKGYSAQDAEDLTQELFARMLARNDFADVSPVKGKFRSFLLKAVNHLLADEWDRATRIKRGGAQPVVSFDSHSGEGHYQLEAADNRNADELYDRQWAMTVIETVLTQLGAEFAAGGKSQLFATLKELLVGTQDGCDYGTAAQRLGMSEGAVRVAVHRLRRKFAESFRDEVAGTLANAADVEAEMRHLLAAVSL
jgi:RNA polymerase sigma-70 factor (ECF subfamily)